MVLEKISSDDGSMFFDVLVEGLAVLLEVMVHNNRFILFYFIWVRRQSQFEPYLWNSSYFFLE